MHFCIIVILFTAGRSEFCGQRRCSLCRNIMMAAWRTPAFSGFFKECQKITSCCDKEEVFGRSETTETRGGANVLVIGIFGSLLGFALAGALFLLVTFLIDKHTDSSNFSQMRRQSRARSMTQDTLEIRRLTLTSPNDVLSGNRSRRPSVGIIQTRGSISYNNNKSRRPSSLSFIHE